MILLITLEKLNGFTCIVSLTYEATKNVLENKDKLLPSKAEGENPPLIVPNATDKQRFSKPGDQQHSKDIGLYPREWEVCAHVHYINTEG